MAFGDVGLSDLGSAQSPLPGLDPSDYEGFGTGGNISGLPSDPGFGSALGVAGLGAGVLGLGAMLAQGPPQLPSQFGQAQAGAYGQAQMGSQMFGQGSPLVAQGQQALAMAQQGQLTPEQQAQLRQYSTGLQSNARQQFYNMGVNPDANTAFTTQQGNIDTQINAMAQQQIQSTIQLGLGEIKGGTALETGGVQAISAADQTLIAAGNAQLQSDQNYSNSLTKAFTSIGTMAAFALL